MKTKAWHGCYDGGWNGLICPEAYSHPAKFSYRLIQRIVSFGLEQGFWKPGDTLGDPFGGVGLGGIVAAYAGLNWVGVELEKTFYDLAKQNFGLHAPKWLVLGQGSACMIHGDSRNFAALVGELGGIVTSPPYADSVNSEAHGIDWSKAGPATGNRKRGEGSKHEQTLRDQLAYGTTPGQIGALPSGKLDGVITSPPYADITNVGEYRDPEKCKAREERYLSAHPELKGKRPAFLPYGTTPGQIGNEKSETYWSACAQVYSQMRLAMKPGGVACLVVKDYVKNKKRVPLCDQTCQLLESLGFKVFLRVKAMLVKETKHPGLFGEQVERRERKSFFRRLAESKGSPRIDWEEVIFAGGQLTPPVMRRRPGE